jgi:hypothetical protein
MGDPDQRDKTLPAVGEFDPADHLAVDIDRRRADPLHQCSHTAYLAGGPL